MFRAYCTSSILAICVFALLIPCVVAQDAQHRILYGQGVHAYYNGDYESAVRYLTITISKNTNDPRSYYFRGLANAKLGNDEASLADLKKGAAIEALDNRGVYQISTALQRIQGQPRLQIEKLRQQARRDRMTTEKVRLQARYEQQQRDETAVLRKPSQTAASIPADAETPIHASSPFAPNNIDGVRNSRINTTSSKPNPTPSAGNGPFAPENKPTPANPTPPAGNNPAPTAPQDEGGGGGILGSIFRAINPFDGNSGNAEPNAEGTLDKLKTLIPGLEPTAPAAPAPGGNPFK
jgi:hypothetical protein